jgi:hypothetical protein
MNRDSCLTAFGSNLHRRIENGRDLSLVDELQAQIRGLPLLPSPTLTAAKQQELDKLGTELWNFSTRLPRDEPAVVGNAKEESGRKNRALCLLRTFAFFVLDSAATHAKGRTQKSYIRLMKVALKAARVCIDRKELLHATKVLERAAEYQAVLRTETDCADGDEAQVAPRLRMEYFAVRILLVRRFASISSLSSRGHC